MSVPPKRFLKAVAVLIVLVCLGGGALAYLRRTPPPLEAQDRWPPGDYERSFVYDGRTRTFLLHIPPGYDGSTPFPLVIGLHGGTGSARQFERSTHMNRAADTLGFLAVYPDGTGPLKTWNAGYCCGFAMQNKVDDVGFIRALIAALSSTLNIDLHRLYATGMSNGAMLAYRLASEASDLFAAVGPVAGSIGGQVNADAPLFMIAPPAEPVSVIAIHGQQDESVLYEGGESRGVFGKGRIDLSVAESIAFWVRHNQCSTMPTVESLYDGNIIRETYPCPQGVEVVLYTIVEGDHSWPGEAPSRLRGTNPNQDIIATDLILEFFASHAKP